MATRSRIRPGDVISHARMCDAEGIMLQHGMNYRPGGRTSILLMSVRRGAPYEDQTLDEGRVLIYEGHDIARTRGGPDPKSVDQPMHLPRGRLTRNGRFFEAAQAVKRGKVAVELVKVYEKIRAGIWVYNGVFRLVDAWQERSHGRSVFKFKLEVHEGAAPTDSASPRDLPHNRMIPTAVKLEVWKRDGGRCVKCGSTKNLHFDHDVPFSKGGTSLTAANIQLLCAKHNIQKRDKIQ